MSKQLRELHDVLNGLQNYTFRGFNKLLLLGVHIFAKEGLKLQRLQDLLDIIEF